MGERESRFENAIWLGNLLTGGAVSGPKTAIAVDTQWQHTKQVFSFLSGDLGLSPRPPSYFVFIPLRILRIYTGPTGTLLFG